MNKVIRILAIAALLATIAGACAVLYGVNTLVPEVVQVTVTATPAAQVRDTFDAIMAQTKAGTFAGRMLLGGEDIAAEDAAFLTYTVRLKNRGFFPAEWISLQAPAREDVNAGTHDILQTDQYGANVLAAGSEGDIAATVLTTIDAANTYTVLEGSCYVLGEKKTFSVAVQ